MDVGHSIRSSRNVHAMPPRLAMVEPQALELATFVQTLALKPSAGETSSLETRARQPQSAMPKTGRILLWFPSTPALLLRHDGQNKPRRDQKADEVGFQDA